MLTPPDDAFFMRHALREAGQAFREGEVPIGCVVVRQGTVIGRGYNRMEGLKDPTAHAEILAIGSACTKVDNWRLEGCTLYCTLEPCPMCAGAILNSRMARVVFGSPDKRLGALGSTYDILSKNPLNREIEVVGGVLAEESLDLIRSFFQRLRSREAPSLED